MGFGLDGGYEEEHEDAIKHLRYPKDAHPSVHPSVDPRLHLDLSVDPAHDLRVRLDLSSALSPQRENSIRDPSLPVAAESGKIAHVCASVRVCACACV